jgi:hypothetical protein
MSEKKKWKKLSDLQEDAKKAEIICLGKDYRPPEGASIHYLRSDIREQDYRTR